MFPLVSHAEVSLPVTEQHFLARYLYQRGIEAKIDPIRLISVSICESGLSVKTKPNGNENGSIDTGLMRVNSIHLPETKKLGLSIANYEDNVSYALILIKKNGWRDYSASKSCWSKKETEMKVYQYLSMGT